MFIGGMVAIPVVYGIVLPTLMELLISDLGLVSGLQSSMASLKKKHTYTIFPAINLHFVRKFLWIPRPCSISSRFTGSCPHGDVLKDGSKSWPKSHGMAHHFSKATMLK
jgi:hypothetical protein